jgi:hypothetical protein
MEAAPRGRQAPQPDSRCRNFIEDDSLWFLLASGFGVPLRLAISPAIAQDDGISTYGFQFRE